MAAHQARTGDITGFIILGDSPFPMATTRSNGLAGIFPLDALAWTAETSRSLTALTQAARDEGMTGSLSLGITGTATPLAQKQIAALGWKLQQKISR
jgi:hypothetical protein